MYPFHVLKKQSMPIQQQNFGLISNELQQCKCSSLKLFLVYSFLSFPFVKSVANIPMLSRFTFVFLQFNLFVSIFCFGKTFFTSTENLNLYHISVLFHFRSFGSSLEVLCQMGCTRMADSALFPLHKESIQGDRMTYLSSSL